MSADPVVVFLAEQRRAHGLSLRRLGEIADIHFTMLADWERGRRTPKLDGLRRWSRALGFDVTVTPILMEVVR